MIANNETEIALINHDLRNNVGAAISFLQMLTISSPQLKDNEYLKRVLANLDHSVELTRTISENCKVEKDQITGRRPDLSIVSIQQYWGEYAKEAYQNLRTMYDVDITESYKTLDEEKYIAINFEEIDRARENVINNAVKAGATKIEVECEMKESYAVVIVRDNGNGMTQEDIDKIMLSRHGDGIIHGLGTQSLIKALCDHGFYMSLDSEPGKGTAIRVICPYINV
jgi:signal transduction histidine kinase